MEIKDNHRIYGLDPFIPKGARVLVLGSMPSVTSLDANFYYMHKQNRFFKLVGLCVGEELDSIKKRKCALESMHIALYDVISSCVREGSLDSKIQQVVPSDIKGLISQNPSIKRIITNGALAKKLFLKYSQGISFEVLHLPSTSPANAMYNLERLARLYLPALTEF